MKKYLVEFTLMGSDELLSVTLYAKNFDGAFAAAMATRKLNTLLTIKEQENSENRNTAGFTITLTPEKSEEIFYDALCNGLGYFLSYGFSLETIKHQADEARKKLTKPCYEDLLMQILRDGGTLMFIDEEGEGDNNVDLTLDMVHKGVIKTPINHLMDFINEEDDAETSDVVIQSVLFGEIVYG